jgi:hypothetical protein
MGMSAMAMKVDEKAVNREVEVALGVMGLHVVEEPPEPVENVWQSTRGLCLSHEGFKHPCPVEWCRFHVCCGMRDEAVARLSPDSDTCVLRMACGTPHTLEEVGQAFGITRERIRQLEQIALSRAGMGLVRIGVISQAEVESDRLARLRHASRVGKAIDQTVKCDRAIQQENGDPTNQGQERDDE